MDSNSVICSGTTSSSSFFAYRKSRKKYRKNGKPTAALLYFFIFVFKLFKGVGYELLGRFAMYKLELNIKISLPSRRSSKPGVSDMRERRAGAKSVTRGRSVCFLSRARLTRVPVQGTLK